MQDDMISHEDDISEGTDDLYNNRYIQSDLPPKHFYSDQNNRREITAKKHARASSYHLDPSNARLESTKIKNKSGMRYDYKRNKSEIHSDEENIYPDGEEEYNKVLHKYGMHRNAGQPRPKR